MPEIKKKSESSENYLETIFILAGVSRSSEMQIFHLHSNSKDPASALQ